MPSRRAKDYPGAWWHVTNRGIAKRTAFENGHDVETFLALLGTQVEGGLLEVHAYAVMTTHLHLLVRSPQGRLPRAMQLVFREIRTPGEFFDTREIRTPVEFFDTRVTFGAATSPR